MSQLLSPLRVLTITGLAGLAVLMTSCTDTTTPPVDDGVVGFGGGTVSFTVSNTTDFTFTGSGVWPLAGTGVIAAMDSSREILQIGGYRQMTRKVHDEPTPGAKFDFIYMLIIDTAGISPKTYTTAGVVIGLGIDTTKAESLAYFGTSGSITLASVTSDAVTGTFAGAATRPSDSAVVAVTAGIIDVNYVLGLVEDRAPPRINVTVGKGTSPVYSWDGGAVYALSVFRKSKPAIPVWAIISYGTDGISSGLTHGEVPAGVDRIVNTEPILTAGVEYTVTVARSGGVYGSKDFTP